MKITGSDFNSIYSRRINNNTVGGKVRKSEFSAILNAESTGAKDSVAISSGKNISDDEFVAALGRKISADVRSGSSLSDMRNIKEQIALGTYDININDIAKKILP